MHLSDLEADATEIIEVPWTDRWQAYQRLQELEIPCWCQTGRPLRVRVIGPTAAVQVSSVLKRLTASRLDLARSLECCWHLSY